MTPQFLDLDDVLAIHGDQIERYGGDTGIRDPGLLQSALAMPRATFASQYLHPTLPEMAAAYLFHVVQNHPFVDGNKRTGLAVMLGFLSLNGLWLRSEPSQLIDLVMGVASGEIGKPEIAVFVRAHSVPFTS